eukprot:963887-Pelagomonas_calceolata.AAC.3
MGRHPKNITPMRVHDRRLHANCWHQRRLHGQRLGIRTQQHVGHRAGVELAVEVSQGQGVAGLQHGGLVEVAQEGGVHGRQHVAPDLCPGGQQQQQQMDMSMTRCPGGQQQQQQQQQMDMSMTRCPGGRRQQQQQQQQQEAGIAGTRGKAGMIYTSGEAGMRWGVPPQEQAHPGLCITQANYTKGHHTSHKGIPGLLHKAS